MPPTHLIVTSLDGLTVVVKAIDALAQSECLHKMGGWREKKCSLPFVAISMHSCLFRSEFLDEGIIPPEETRLIERWGRADVFFNCCVYGTGLPVPASESGHHVRLAKNDVIVLILSQKKN